MRLANAGHLPALLITEKGAHYVDTPPEVMLGAGIQEVRTTTAVALAPGSTLLLYTDGLIERRDRSLDTMLAELQAAAATLTAQTPDELCDELLARFATSRDDDVCVLALESPQANLNCTLTSAASHGGLPRWCTGAISVQRPPRHVPVAPCSSAPASCVWSRAAG